MPSPLRAFLLTLAGLTALCLLTEAFCARVLHFPYPYNWPLFAPEHSFNDLIIYHPRFPAFGTPAFFDPPWYPFTYPAPMALVYRFLYTFPDYILAFLVLACTAVVAAIALFTRSLYSQCKSAAQQAESSKLISRKLPNQAVSGKSAKQQDESSKLISRKLPNQALLRTLLIVIPTILCAYPIAFEFGQANLEIFVVLLTTAGIWAYNRRQPWPAAILFGLGASLKLFPIVFLVLFLTRRQYRQAAVAVSITLATVVLSLAVACPSPARALAGVQAGAHFFEHEYALRTTTAFDHSLFALVKAAAVLHDPTRTFLAPTTLTAYLTLAALAAAATCLRLRRLPFLNQVTALTILAVLLPPVSFDYTLLALYAPWALLVLYTLRCPGTRGLTPMFVCLAVLLAPTTELIVHGIALGAQLKSVTLAALLVVTLRRPFPESAAGDRTGAIMPEGAR